MQVQNKFDEAIDGKFSRFDSAVDARFGQNSLAVIKKVTNKLPQDVRDTSVYLADTLDLCWLAAQAIFGNKARPEHAFAILDRQANLLEKLPAEQSEAKAKINKIPQGTANEKPRDKVEELLAQWKAKV